VPVPNLLFMAVLMSVVVFATISPTLGEQFGKLIAVSVILCLLLYVYACLALLRHRRWVRAGSGLDRYRPVAIAALLFCVVVIAYAEFALLILTAAMIALSALIYWLFGRRWQKT
jgi:arginine:agmatine antiporter